MNRFLVLTAICLVICGVSEWQQPAFGSDRDEAHIVYLLGKTADSQEFIQPVDAGVFTSRLTTIFHGVNQALLPLLQKQLKQSHPALEMRTLGVGVSVSGQIGLGPLWHASVAPKIRLVYSNSRKPVYPD